MNKNGNDDERSAVCRLVGTLRTPIRAPAFMVDYGWMQRKVLQDGFALE
jgi:hypothetical protein